MQLGFCADFLCPFIWSHVSGQMWFCNGTGKGAASNFVQFSEKVPQTLAMIRQAFGKENVSRAQKVQTHRDRKMWDKWRAKSSILIIFSDIKGLFTKNSSWLPKQSIPHTMTFYGNYVKMQKEFAQNFGDKRTGCCITTTHILTLPFSPGNSWPKTTWLSSLTHPTFLCFADWR
jgi:hypothetical protein